MDSTTSIDIEPYGELSHPKPIFWIKIWNLGLVLLVLSTIFLVLAKTVADPDLWGHLRFGLDILEARSIPRVDPYSYISAGQPWINHEWLSEVLFGLAWQAGGVTGLVLLKILAGFLTIGLVFWLLTSLGIQPLRGAILLFISIFLLMPTIGTIRPHMFTTLGFALTVVLLYKAESGQYRWLWAFPVLFAIWPNLHGGFLAGGGIVAFWTLFHLPGHYRQWQKFLPPLALSAAATLLTPYGPQLLLFLLRTATVPRPEITEWAPLQLTSIIGISYITLLAASVLGLVYSRRPRKTALVLLFGVTALLPLLAVRHVNLFALAALAFTGEHAADAWIRFRRRPQRLIQPPVILAVLPALATAGLLFYALPFLTRVELDETQYPVTAVEILKESRVTGNLATMFNWGEYILWHLGPQVKVMMDGRRETVYSPELYQQYLQFQFGFKEWDALLKKYPADIALVHHGEAPHNLLNLKDEWRLVYEDETSALFVRRSSSLEDPLLEAAKGAAPPDGPLYFP